MNNILKLSINSDFNSANLAAQLYSNFLILSGFEDNEAAMLELAIVESINNVIEHAYKMQGANLIELSCIVNECAFTFEVFDQGVILDANKLLLAGSENESSVEGDMQERGRGLALIKSIMDDVIYSSNNGVNHITLIKKRV